MKLIRENVLAYAVLHTVLMAVGYAMYVTGQKGVPLILWYSFGGFWIVLVTTYLQCRRLWKREEEKPSVDYIIPIAVIVIGCYATEKMLQRLLF